MCFSPQASFGAAAVLSVLGIIGLKKQWYSQDRLIAAVPFFFAMQQALEGFVWISLQHNETPHWLYYLSTYGFLLFAAMWWPVYVPAILWYLEADPQRKKILFYPLCAGLLVMGIAILNLISGGLEAIIVGHHIAYQSQTSTSINSGLYYCGLVCYLIATTGALCISSKRFAWVMGILIIIAFATAQVWYYYAFGSVWCFFAALCSGLLVYAL